MPITTAIAKYINQRLEEFKGNPLIEAIPARMSEEELLKTLFQAPEFNEEQRSWDSFERELCAKRLQRCLVPTNRYYQFYKMFYAMLSTGYIAKNPLSPKTVEWLYDRTKSVHISEKTTADTLMICGLSGLGKSTMVERTLSLFPQVILHTNYYGRPFQAKQILYLKFSIPPDGTRKGLFLRFFLAVDSLIGSDYAKQYGGKTMTVESQREGMDQICKTYWIGVIIIDELQNLNVATFDGKTQILQLFDEIANLTQVPIIKIGTTDSLRLFAGKFTSARRASSVGNIELERYKSDELDWQIMCEISWRCQWTKTETKLSDDIRVILYSLTQGIPFCLFRLLELANIEAISSGKEKIDKKILLQVYKKHFGLMKYALTALSKNRTAMFDDLATASEWFESGGDKGSISKLINLIDSNDLSSDAAKEILNAVNKISDNFELSETQKKKVMQMKTLLESSLNSNNKQALLNQRS